MTTLFDLTLQVAKQVTEVIEGTATAGSATTLTDAATLRYPRGFFTRGALWIKSGTHQGKTVIPTDFADGVLTFATLTTSIGTARYAVIPEEPYPYPQIVLAINSALDDSRAWVLKKDDTLTGDGETLEFTLPSGVYDVAKIQQFDPAYPDTRFLSNHWTEQAGKLVFDRNHEPVDGWTIRIWYKGKHSELTTYSDTLDNSLSVEWLKWKAVENLLTWSMRRYQNKPEMQLDQFLNQAMDRVSKLRPRREPLVMIRTASAIDWE